MSITQLVESLKGAGQDFEFYPTTDEIINKLASDIRYYSGEYYGRTRKKDSILDIGAGNGKVLKALRGKPELDSLDLYAIEKSTILCAQLDKDVYIIGTDFLDQSLFEKQIGITFCNPPYSEFKTWAVKIIRESASAKVYLVLPQRWKDSKEIQDALKYRDAKYKILGDFSFENAEDRTARAVVNLLRIELSTEKDDAFDRFFNEQFAELKAKFSDKTDDNKPDYQKQKEEGEQFKALVLGENYLERLVEMYDAEMKHIRNNYDLVSKLDADLLREFDVTPARILECLKKRLSGLKNLYWQEIMSRMSQVTDRLISKKRTKLLETINHNGHVDFTKSNVYAVILWILKNSGAYIDEQLIEVYDSMINQANVQRYKSNTRPFVKDDWRYNQEKPTHIFLEYRIVLESWGGIHQDFSGTALSEYACEHISDLLTVAKNLGVDCQTTDERLSRWKKNTWEPGQAQVFTCRYKDRPEVLFEVKAYLNHNIHIRMNQKFALALNVEYGRLKGWLKNGQEAATEIQNDAAQNYFKTNYCLSMNPALMLTDQTEQTGEEKEKRPEIEEPTQMQLAI